MVWDRLDISRSVCLRKVKVKPMKIALVPAYNSVHTIAEVVLKTKEVVDMVIVFDDGSTDDTAYIAEKCGAKLIKSDRNRGKGFALRELFDSARKWYPEVTVTLDADMQHNPRDIPKLIQPILEDRADVAIATREKIPKLRSFGNKLLDYISTVSFLRKLYKIESKETQSGFRAYSAKTLKKIDITTHGFGVDSEIYMKLKKLGMRFWFVPVGVRYDKYSHKKNPVSHFMQVFNFIFLKRPLLHLGLLGAIGFLTGLFGLVDVVNWWNVHQELAIGRLLFSMTVLLLGTLTFFVGLIIHVIRSEKR